MVVILGFSSSGFSAEHTGGVLQAILGWVWPTATTAQLAWAHALLRKTAHVVEYAVLGTLWFRALVHAAPARPARAAALAVVIAAAWAVVDETHQATLATRTGSVLDVALDTAGAGAAVLAARIGYALGGDLATTVLLWLVAVGGVAVIGVDVLGGVDAGSLWITVPAAGVLLLVRWWRPGRRARPGPAARASDPPDARARP